MLLAVIFLYLRCLMSFWLNLNFLMFIVWIHRICSALWCMVDVDEQKMNWADFYSLLFYKIFLGFLSDWGMFVWIHCDSCYFFVAWANDLACVNFFMSICLNFEHFWYIIIWLNLVCSVILNNVRNFFIERQSPLLFLSINILNYFRFEWFSLFLVLLSCSKFIKFFFTVPQLWTYGLILLSSG